MSKKSVKDFIKLGIILIASLFIGFFIGSLGIKAVKNIETLYQGFITFVNVIVPYAMFVVLAGLLAGVILFIRYKKLAKKANLATADDETFDKLDSSLEKALNTFSISSLFSLFFYGIIAGNIVGLVQVNVSLFFVCTGLFLIEIIVSAVFSYLLVEESKKMYPEKKGSVFDFKFQKDWYESCDEMERKTIGNAAYKTYSVMSSTLLTLWVIITLLSMFIPSIGILPSLIIGLLWVIQNITYLKASSGKPKTRS
jgi:hypothetical protein